MSAIDDGGPAFPVENAHAWQAHGMSLRDYFALHATEADILDQFGRLPLLEQIPVAGHSDDWRQRARYMHADAMLAARRAQR